MRRSILVVFGCAALLGACGRGRLGAADPGPAGGASAAAASAAPAWLCRPDRPGDPCAAADLTATDIHADGSRVRAPHPRALAPKVDCFYVYPTVDLDLVPGNHQDLSDARRPLAATLAQVGRFQEACALWVPLYRQVTLGTWLQPRAELERGLAIAYADVERAFTEYLGRADPSRRIVLVGHSQGAEMVVRLLRRFFERDAAMRARLVLAMAIGGEVETAAGRATGGTFASIPVCTRPLETGCVVAYRSHAAGVPVEAARWTPGPGRETACVDPASLDGPRVGAERRLAGATFAVGGDLGRFLRGVSDVTTPFVVYPDLYEARCVRGERGYAYLEIAASPAEGDARGAGPLDLRGRRLRIGRLGLHVLDLQLPQQDLVAMIARRAAGP